ncbi:hypothetical protein VitviT2T_020412 [Vitis vinifera]|uniref:Annexin D3 n=1 Tax=Vitis vinifera TaxID=29760 RepID=A0ABY9D3N0_VITVI|nr:hypothetical protein VitviT2T_020412 [Vitis vinifera]
MAYWMEEPPERDAKLVEKTLKRGKAGITQLQVIVEIACASSPNHLIAVRQAYCSLFDCSLVEAITSKVSSSLQKAIMSSGSHDLGSLLRVVILCIDAPEKHFAEVIRASLSGHRTDVHSLARAILARVEIDMMKIKEEYFNMNKVSLDDAVVRKTSGGYKDFLMTLIGARI